MQYTLGAAKELIAPMGASAYGVTDPKVSINKAIRALAAMSGWKCLRQTYRFSAVAPEFALPQGSDGLVRVCVNGQPASVRSRSFTYLQSGIGAAPPPGYVEIPVRNIVDEGFFPVQDWPPGPQRLVAVTRTEPAPGSDVALRVTYEDGVGVRCTTKLPAVWLEDGVEPTVAYTAEGVVASRIVSVTLTAGVTSHIQLYAFGQDEVPVLAATYHPLIKAPSFRWYKIPGLPPGAIVDILAESRIDPLPLEDDSDVIPFTTIEPIEWMIRADYESKSGEVDRAQKYREAAAQWLTQQETTDETVQEPIVINSIYDGSPGEVSADSWNI